MKNIKEKLLEKNQEELINIIIKQMKEKEELIGQTKKLKAEIRYLHLEQEKLIKKYEDKINQYQLNIYNQYITKSEQVKDEIINEVEVQVEKEEKNKPKKKRKRQIEQFVKELKEMVTRTKIIDFDFEKNKVDKNKVKKFGEDKSIKIETKTSFEIVEIIRPKYKDKEKIYQAKNEDVFPNSILTPSLASNIINFKYRLSIPLYRYSQMLKESGINISESNLCNYVSRTAEKIKKVYDKIKEELIKTENLHIDETPLEVIDIKDKKKCYMFVYRSSYWEEKQISLYEFNISRKTDKVEEILKEYKGNVECDGYTGYDFLKKKGIKIQRCWVHIRRYFMDCYKILKKSDKYKHPAYKIVKKINKLFEQEAIYKEKKYDYIKIKEERNKKEYKEILKDIDREIEKLSNIETKSENIQKAITYYNNIKEKEELYTFLEDGKMQIDNNIAERTVKPFVIGRKNFLFSKTKNGAEISAVCYTIVQTALNNLIEPEKYIKYLLENIEKEDIEELMPWSKKIKSICKINFKEEKKTVLPEKKS